MGVLDKIKGNTKAIGSVIGLLSPPNAVNEITNGIMKIARGEGHLPDGEKMRRLIDPHWREGRDIKSAGILALAAIAAREFEVPVVKGYCEPIIQGSIGYMIGRTINHAIYWASHDS